MVASVKILPPLANGDHLDQTTFHERYEAMPDVRAELIGGIVYVSSPMKRPHGRSGILLSRWLGEYEEATPGSEAHAGATDILGPDSEPEPDGSLIILPEYGGQTWEDERGYLNGAPEWVGEISDSTESIDLHSKMRDYERAGVREYMVVALHAERVFWFTRRRGKFKERTAGREGVIRSEVFPGLWIEPAAFLRRDAKRLMAVLREGLSSPEHTSFVAQLANKK
ncbi:MAG TPA: Uma2 family endonuclease [Pirellulales bacterium]|jgi:Uma2 family endonuclease|nr:Uma2 family endonuclease [Pirellulales bacterium]